MYSLLRVSLYVITEPKIIESLPQIEIVKLRLFDLT